MYNPQILLMSKKIYAKLNDGEKKLLAEVAAEAKLFHRQLSQQKNADALATLKIKLTVNELPPAEIAKMKEKAKPVIDKFTRVFGEPLVQEMYAQIEKASKAK
jgi:TRAP-type transport system periplasmic protein